MTDFKLKSDWKPAGDQPEAIKALLAGLEKGMAYQTLLGVTGSGKTFTMANVIQAVNKPTLVIAHNKTLAAQLAEEYKHFFPENAVHYFVSYYDYYQPEAYMPITDTYIEKDAQINEEIERLRHASTQALLTRRDVIIVASVSCIYGLGDPEEYLKLHLSLKQAEKTGRNDILYRLISIHFERTSADLAPGKFRAVGNSIEIMPIHEKVIYNLFLSADEIREILVVDPVSRKELGTRDEILLFPAKHFLTPEDERKRAIKNIKAELKIRLSELKKQKKLLAAERLRRRTNYDLAMIKEIGYSPGIENYSRHLAGRPAGSPPDTLLSYFPDDFLTIIDESHVTVPQISGMYEGDRSRKKTLVEHGFRLPSALDNRPLKFKEFEERLGPVVFTSATPGKYEFEKSVQIVEQIIRPTGLVDPEIEVRPILKPSQVEDCIKEIIKVAKQGNRSLVTTLTKKMAEELADYLKESGVKAEYLHSEIKTLDRIKILTNFRKGPSAGGFDVLVGVNLLREGLDLPEVAFIAILDADKEGFLRSDTSLIQTIGRAARNVDGRVILYANSITDSMQRALDETSRRRKKQIIYNKKNKITPKSINKKIYDMTEELESKHKRALGTLLDLETGLYAKDPKKFISEKKSQMEEAVKRLDFETAAILRDEIKELEKIREGRTNSPTLMARKLEPSMKIQASKSNRQRRSFFHRSM